MINKPKKKHSQLEKKTVPKEFAKPLSSLENFY